MSDSFESPWTVAPRFLCPWDFPCKNTEWIAISSSGDLPDPGIEPSSPALAGGFFTTEPPGKPVVHVGFKKENLGSRMEKRISGQGRYRENLK